MNNNLLKSDNYYVFTFSSTSHALKAERVLKALKAEFLVIPTLREISTSCGLSVKISPEKASQYYDDLIKNKVDIDGIYQVEKQGREKQISKIEMQ